MLGLGNGIAHGLGTYSPWNPLDDDCVLWLTANPNWVKLASGSTTEVEQWNAQIPIDGSMIFAQATSSARPAWYASNHGEVLFTGSENDHQLDADTKVTLDTSVGGWTMAMRVKMDNWVGANQVIFGDGDSSNHFFRHDVTNKTMTLKIGETPQTRTFTIDTPDGLTPRQYYNIVLVSSSSGDLVLYIDNVAQGDTETFNPTRDFILTEIGGKAGASQTMDGGIKSIILFDKAADALMRNNIEELLNQTA